MGLITVSSLFLSGPVRPHMLPQLHNGGGLGSVCPMCWGSPVLTTLS